LSIGPALNVAALARAEAAEEKQKALLWRNDGAERMSYPAAKEGTEQVPHLLPAPQLFNCSGDPTRHRT
jgi:hypothetical protein